MGHSGDLQESVMEAWQEKGKEAMRIIEAGLRAPSLVKPEAIEQANLGFQYYGTHYQYWMMFGHNGHGEEVK